MRKLSIDQLHAFRLSIFENAESLYEEAILLQENGKYARAYLLAYFACEELGKIPIVVGVISKLMQGKKVDWAHVKRRFRDHKAKVESEDHHHYVFGLESDLLNNSDVKWLAEQKSRLFAKVNKKNMATYVDTIKGNVLLPLKEISSAEAKELIARTHDSLKAHWQSESFSNPVIKSRIAMQVESKKQCD